MIKYFAGFLCLFAILGCKPIQSSSKEKINVLFIGNSLTYYHDMPKTLQKMLDETNPVFNIEQSTFPGMSLSKHLQNIIFESNGDNISTRKKQEGEITDTEKKIIEKDWDFIVLQEATGNLYFPKVVEEIIGSTIKDIESRVTNSNCKFIIFKTWPSKEVYPREKVGVPKHLYNREKYYVNEKISNQEKFYSQEILNLDEDVKVLNEAYNSLAEKEGFMTTNHTNLYQSVIKKNPEINLYDDEYHPSEAGSFLNACEFYSIFTNNKPSKLKYNGNLNIKEATILKRVVSKNK